MEKREKRKERSRKHQSKTRTKKSKKQSVQLENFRRRIWRMFANEVLGLRVAGNRD
jgi:hypothetical protein